MAVDLQQQVSQLQAALATERAKVWAAAATDGSWICWMARSITICFSLPQVDERELAYNAAAQVLIGWVHLQLGPAIWMI
jgi:hypothetical protein